jgi:hypothetical protein
MRASAGIGPCQILLWSGLVVSIHSMSAAVTGHRQVARSAAPGAATITAHRVLDPEGDAALETYHVPSPARRSPCAAGPTPPAHPHPARQSHPPAALVGVHPVSSVPSLIPRSRATSAIGLPVSRTSGPRPPGNRDRTSCVSAVAPPLKAMCVHVMRGSPVSYFLVC